MLITLFCSLHMRWHIKAPLCLIHMNNCVLVKNKPNQTQWFTLERLKQEDH